MGYFYRGVTDLDLQIFLKRNPSEMFSLMFDILKTFSKGSSGRLLLNTAQRVKFSMKDFFSKCDQTAVEQFSVDLVCGFGHITEEILNGKLHFLCSEI